MRPQTIFTDAELDEADRKIEIFRRNHPGWYTNTSQKNWDEPGRFDKQKYVLGPPCPWKDHTLEETIQYGGLGVYDLTRMSAIEKDVILGCESWDDNDHDNDDLAVAARAILKTN